MVLQVVANPGANRANVVDQRGKVTQIFAQDGYYKLELPEAVCFEDSGECFVGGEPRMLVEHIGCDPSLPEHQRKCVLWLAAGAGPSG